MNLIADLANFYGKKIASLLLNDFTQSLIQSLSKFAYIQENNDAKEYAISVIIKKFCSYYI